MNPHIQTLRGIACLLVVFYHVIGPDPSGGLRIAEGAFRSFNDALAYLRMPLFTILSGLVYGLRPFRPDGNSRAFLIGKVRRLLVPMLVVGTGYALAQAVVPGANSVVGNWWLLHIVPVGHFWFLESLFWVFLLVWALDKRALLSRPAYFGVAWFAAAGLCLGVRAPRLFGLDGAIYLLPYFLAGLALTRFEIWARLREPWLLATLTAIALSVAWKLGWPPPMMDRHGAWTLVAGLSSCGICLALRLEWSWLARIGTSSYAIYLFHVFFTAASRITLERLGVPGIVVPIAFGTALGVLGPMAVESLALRWRWPALLLLGKSIGHKARTTELREGAFPG